MYLGETFSMTEIFQEWQNARRYVETEALFLRESKKYPLTAFDKFNLYAVFSELFFILRSGFGYSGIVVKGGLITDKLCSAFLNEIFSSLSLVKVYEFENKRKIFPDVHPQERFALVTLGKNEKKAILSFDNLEIGQALQAEKQISMSYDDLILLSPNTKNCPKFANRKDFEITKRCYSKYPAFICYDPMHNPWEASIDRYINVSDFSDVIITSKELVQLVEKDPETALNYIPLYEGKLFHQYDHRFSTYKNDVDERTADFFDKSPDKRINFLKYIPKEIAFRRNPYLERSTGLLAVRDITNRTNRTNERGVIASIIPPDITDYTVRIVRAQASSLQKLTLLSLFNSFAFDYLVRQRIGGTHLSNYILEQAPVFSPQDIEQCFSKIITQSALELTYTAYDLEGFAIDCLYQGQPFKWDENRRFLLRCEIDSAFFHIYELSREDLDYIMEAFPIVKRKDEKKYGEYRTKRVILECYDAMVEAIRTGRPYQTILDPPPADPRVAHQPERVRSYL